MPIRPVGTLCRRGTLTLDASRVRTEEAPPALFVGSIAALVAIVTMPQLLGDRVADGFDGLAAAEASWLWLAACAFGASLFASASGWASALTRCGGDDDAPGRVRSLLHRLARERRRARAARQRRPLRALRPRPPERGPDLDGRRDRDVARRDPPALAGARACARLGERPAAALADRAAPARRRGRGRRRLARPQLPARNPLRPCTRRFPRPRPLPPRRRADRRLDRARDGIAARRRRRASLPLSGSTIP